LKITNAWICQIEENNIKPVFGDIYIRNGTIIDIQRKKYNDYVVETENKTAAKSGFNVQGRVITVPQINFHEHFYSRLAKGLSINGPMDNFENILDSLWWKLDKILDRDMIIASVQMAALESIQNGVTYIFDHHASQKFVKDSLSDIADILKKIGLRAVLCFETSDRNGDKLSKAALRENERYAKFQNGDLKAMMGLHASFTLKNETLEEAGKIIEANDLGIHIHLSEGDTDRKESQRLHGNLPTRRLKKYNLLNKKSILAHGVDLIDEDYMMLKDSESALVYNIDSNLNNAVGIPDYKNTPQEIPILVGTDGMHANIAKSMKQLFLFHRHQKNSFDNAFTYLNKSYFDQINFVKRYYPDFPSLQLGDRADFIVWDYIPPTPFTSENFFGHYIYGMCERPIQSTIQNGKFLMKNHQISISAKQEMELNIHQQGRKLYNKFA
jgi:cytosine/adenosine deaminase-related metal-dependent hydrolase